jgi:hypothetical protein|tara:strand:- start:22 stop:429 length:408 start_codon:yes stop_codon:yes gene_type:complete
MVGVNVGLTERKERVMLRDDAIYLAGLFDGEGCVQFHRRYRRKKKGAKKAYANLICTLDISMTDKETIEYVRKITGLGSVNIRIKNKSPSSKAHWKDQYRWNVSHRQAYEIAKHIAPFAITKQGKLLEIVNHYVN